MWWDRWGIVHRVCYQEIAQSQHNSGSGIAHYLGTKCAEYLPTSGTQIRGLLQDPRSLTTCFSALVLDRIFISPIGCNRYQVNLFFKFNFKSTSPLLNVKDCQNQSGNIKAIIQRFVTLFVTNLYFNF